MSKLWFAKHSSVLDVLKNLSVRGLEVVTFVKSNSEKEERLKETGASIRVNDSRCNHRQILDMVWQCQLSWLQHRREQCHTYL